MVNFLLIFLRFEFVFLLKLLLKLEFLKLILNWLLDMVFWVVFVCIEDVNKMLVVSKEIIVFIKNNF